MPYIDIVYEIVDARIPFSSKIQDIDNIIKNKIKILIMTKKDLCDLSITNNWVKYYEGMGLKVLLIDLNDNNDYKKITTLTNEVALEINKKRAMKGLKEKEIKAVVIGVPNVGKSTLINKLAGKKATKVGNLPGVTKNLTWLKTKYKLVILDTPGILWPKFDSENIALNLAAMTAINENVLPINDVAGYILKMLSEYYPDILFARFKVKEYNDDTYEIIAKNIGAINNGVVDYKRVSIMIINEIKKGNIKGITFDRGKDVRI
jgi:ribosome biogenesis GTPase A